MPLPELALALALLLLTPGPTNTLMAVAGAERGVRRAARLIPAEIAAYLAVTLPLAAAGAAMTQALPGIRPALTAGAAVWVAWLALSLWRQPLAAGDARTGAVTAARVFATTLANPKALVIGLALLPGGPLAPRAALLAGLIAVAAAAWIAAGATLARGTGRTGALRRAAALWLAMLAAGLAYGAAGAA